MGPEQVKTGDTKRRQDAGHRLPLRATGDQPSLLLLPRADTPLPREARRRWHRN